MKDLLKNIHFDMGLDPNLRIAENAGELSEDKTMLRLSRYAEECGIKCEFDAKFMSNQPVPDDKNAEMTLGASILRDCYGKVNTFIAHGAQPCLPAIAKLLKAYKQKIRIAAAGPVPPEANLTNIDETVTVETDATEQAKKLAEDLEQLRLGPVAAATLAAATQIAKRAEKHDRVVVLLTE